MTSDFFSYHINWKSRGVHPGRHKSDQRGMGIEFAGHSNLLDYPDPRRIDLRMTMRDPMEQVYVRIFNQRSATPVMIFSDLSSSMRFGDDQNNKLIQASEIARIIKNSAYDLTRPSTHLPTNTYAKLEPFFSCWLNVQTPGH